MVQANVDKIIDFVKTKKEVSLPEISRVLGIPKEDVQKSLQYLEEDGILKIDYKFTTLYVTFLKLPVSQSTISPMNLEEPKQQTLNLGNGLNLMQPPISSFALNEPFNPQKTEPFILPSENPMSPMPPMPGQIKEEVKIEVQAEPKETASTPQITPFETTSFELNAPEPEISEPKQVLKPALEYNDEYKELNETQFPEYVTSDLDKLDFMIDEAHKKIVNYQYKGLNVIYREIYNLYRDAELSPNERYLMGSKVNELFQRMKRIYLLEKTV